MGCACSKASAVDATTRGAPAGMKPQTQAMPASTEMEIDATMGALQKEQEAMDDRKALQGQSSTLPTNVDNTDSRRKSAIDVESYTSFDALRALVEEDARLIRASYFLELRARNLPVPRRQEMPEDAFVSVEKLDAIFCELQASSTCATKHTWGFAGLVVLSHAWMAPEHPDGKAQALCEVIAPAIEWYMSERARIISAKAYGWDMGHLTSDDVWYNFAEPNIATVDFGIFYDWGSMFQKPRNELQDLAFRRALSNMDVLYGHQLTMKWRLTKQLSGASGLPYDQRGWPFFETIVSQLCSHGSVVLDLGIIDWPQHSVFKQGQQRSFDVLAKQGTFFADFDRGGVLHTLYAKRTPALTPADFAVEVRKKVFTNNADVDTVISLQERIAAGVFAGVDEHYYSNMGWNASDLDDFLRALSLYIPPRVIKLGSNPLGTEGVKALSQFAMNGGLRSLTELGLNRCSKFKPIDTEGVAALGNALACGSMPNLEILWLWGNPMGDVLGINLAIAATEGHLKNMKILSISGCKLGPDGVKALKQAVASRAMPLLEEGYPELSRQ